MAVEHLKCGRGIAGTAKFYLILVNLTLNSYTWLMTTMLDSVGLDSAGILHYDQVPLTHYLSALLGDTWPFFAILLEKNYF